ncbi:MULTISPECIES: bifunctional 3-(3-hydroxy-phenyl)propionate/3-hydroxycinnamic acid hydroxylase [unclassified Herbaspirillum]|uniref:bifunctional 3-(3-hydroxy-phenyl)propionate/3-hydroxycinnamic acid hydroxylase n=1 Tax=unclassified Herbaspirillum TaxID=2624150 RepID=UPI0011532675|nr:MULTISPECIES: bifunctional 3-(3-hydroxy-phenyl)propionate/3-hydroxycinnamic acid hydroxylase [unclassified Herbaspirillum]MBB5390189.1 3-(3-hydroxy-phenyl)propionate hydroxylase [Herbaspirillum sp. SJZ102]TQK09312.1 3-(3-hydroxy-phenyl)propionate hydroxylase [Herbaspirillum sp. SJZ130]TQK14001.1 3-(3-hydroxy-phenyl)propionate hydroxylase [Herbaspirillum sp. SJZ106]
MSAGAQAQVLIVGAGPVGVTLANLLGTYGIATLVIERNLDVLDYPRAVGIDDEALRTFQAAGMADAIVRDVIQNVPMRMYTADRRCFAEIQPTTREFGWYRRNLFSQPLGEATLRQGLQRFPHVELRSGVELRDLVQDDQGVLATIVDARGMQDTLRAQYAVGCDGGRSTVREKILKLPYEGKTHPAKWVVIECDGDPLDAPYTALHCEPRRPYVCLALPYGVRRWEFMLFPGEDGEQMLAPEKVRELLHEHVADVESLNIIRARVYTHNSRVAGALVCGRICLAGDAAHITPPWIGQGLNAGLRDAFNLGWKLAWILQGRMKPELLASYHEERHAHVKAMIALADLFGAVLSQKNRLLAWCRDKFFLAIKDIARVRDYILQMKFKPMPSFRSQAVIQGDPRSRSDLVGRMFLQSLVENGAGEVVRLDDLCGSRFTLLSWRSDVLAGADLELRRRMEAFGCDYLQGARSRSGQRGQPPTGAGVVIQDYENRLNAWFKEKGVDWVLLRPDRFIAAAGRAEDAPAVMARYLDRVAA